MARAISMLKAFLTRAATRACDDTDWISDPLRHPDLARMDLRELGDLPMPGFARPGPVAKAGRGADLQSQPAGAAKRRRIAC